MIIPATQEHFERLYSGLPRRTTRALVAVKGNEPVGLLGLLPDGDGLLVYGHLTEEIRNDRRLLVQLARGILEAAGDLTLCATASLSVEASGRFLEHFGFTRLHGNIYERRVA